MIPEKIQLEAKQAETYLTAAKNFIITDEKTLFQAGKILHELKNKKNEYETKRKELKAPILKAGKQIDDFFRSPLSFLYQAEICYRTAILKWEKESTQAAIIAQEIKNRKEGEAQTALMQGNEEKFDQLISEVTELMKQKRDKPDGISIRDHWKGEVVNFELLLQAMLEGKAPMNLLVINQQTLDKLASTMKDCVVIPGVRFFNDKIVAVRQSS